MTGSEVAVARLVVEGRTDAEIALARGVARSTVSNQVAAIFRKVGVRSRVELAATIGEREDDPLAAVIDAAHALEGDSNVWLDGVVRAAASALGRGVVGNLVERRSCGTLASVHVALHGVPETWSETLRRTASRMSTAELDRRFTTAVAFERGGIALSARAGDRCALLLDAPFDGPPVSSGTLAATWEHLAEGLAAALRIRSSLLPREREVLALLALGRANKCIAEGLGISESTVSAAIRSIATKLGVRSRVELARLVGQRSANGEGVTSRRGP